MQVIKDTQSVFFDVDDTLVMWGFKDLYSPDTLEVIDESKEKFLIHVPHLEQLKLFKSRGHTVIVWSNGGWEWAEKVVKLLKLEKYVDLVMSKPTWVYDDLSSDEIIQRCQHRYLPLRQGETNGKS